MSITINSQISSIGGALVFSILVAVGIRLCSRKSRLSITYTSLICISGLFILDTWAYVTSVLVRGSHSIYWCGDPGLIAGKWLEGFCSDQKWQLLLTTASVFIWVTLATMKLWTSLARYIINKPYIREIVIETTPKPEKATMPKPVLATESTKKTSRVVRPEDDPPETPRPSKDNKPKKPVQRIFGEDELPKYQMPSPSLLQSHSDKVHEVSKEEINRNSSIIRETLADHKVQITDIKAIPGAEKLLGNGDMIFAQNARLERIQCGYIGPDEITALARAIESQDGFQKSFTTPYYLPEVKDEEDGTDSGPVDMKKIDARFEEAARLVVETQKASTSYLQTTLGMGFAKSARVMSQLEAAGIVGHADGAKPREVLVQDLAELEPILKSYTSH